MGTTSIQISITAQNASLIAKNVIILHNVMSACLVFFSTKLSAAFVRPIVFTAKMGLIVSHAGMATIAPTKLCSQKHANNARQAVFPVKMATHVINAPITNTLTLN